MPIPARVVSLIVSFQRNAADYSESLYGAQLRQQFLNPLFKTLGWDMENEQVHVEAYKVVIYEPSIKIGGETKAPDNCFRIGGTSEYFFEAKRLASSRIQGLDVWYDGPWQLEHSQFENRARQPRD